MDLEVIVTRIRGHLDNINSLSHYPFEICLSIGYDLWDTKNFSKDEFMIHIDKKMYLEKDAKKLILS
jgi:GGDEF domain-containing protein